MGRNPRKPRQALTNYYYDIFGAETLTPPAPATLHTKIAEHERKPILPVGIATIAAGQATDLPTVDQLYTLFDQYNRLYFKGKLPRVKIEYSTRMMDAGAYIPSQKLIRIGRKYHELFPEDVDDTLRHEMIHIIHHGHDAAFKKEAKRIGASLHGKSHPALVKPPKYIYMCPACRHEYPRHRQLRMASCGDCSPKGRFDPRFKLKLISSPATRKTTK